MRNFADNKDERGFQRAVNRAMKEFGEKVKVQTENRQAFVLAKIDEEKARLRPHAKRLLYGPDGGPSSLSWSTRDPETVRAEEKEERAFLQKVNRAMKEFGVEVRAQTERRQAKVIEKIREEMARLRPEARTLLHGPDEN